jgi:NAD-dependent dihydropyrimidine dehydrogenase PreA subunit
MLNPQIDTAKCNGCGLCVGVCQHDGLELVDRVVVFVGGDTCTWCGLCEAVCAEGAVICPFDIVLEES